MQDFIRRNLFYVILASAVVVIGGVLTWLAMSQASGNEELLVKPSETYNSAQGAPRVNALMIQEQEKFNQLVLVQAKEVQNIIAKQADRYPVFKIDDDSGKLINAFPYTGNATWSPLLAKISQAYIKVWTNDKNGGWLKTINSTGPLDPTKDPAVNTKLRFWQEALLSYELQRQAYLTDVLQQARARVTDRITELGASPTAATATPAAAPAMPGRPPMGYSNDESARPPMGDAAAPGAAVPATPEVTRLQNLLAEIQKNVNANITLEMQIHNTLTIIKKIDDAEAKLAGERDPVARRVLQEQMTVLAGDYTTLEAAVDRSTLELRSGVAQLFGRSAGQTRPGPMPAGREVSQADRPAFEVGRDIEGYIQSYLSWPVRLVDARQYAVKDATKERAQAAWIYATLTNLNPVFSKEDAGSNIPKRWAAQVNAWIMSDILDAINKTNQNVLNPLPKERQNIIYSPIKRIVSVNVSHDDKGEIAYFFGQSGSGAPTGAALAPSPAMPPGVSAIPGGFEPGGPAGPMAAPAGFSPDAGSNTGAADSSSLTGRVCCRDYDVVHYQFTVIMPIRYLGLLTNNIQAGRFHTVLKIEKAKVDQTGGVETVAAGPQGETTTGSYYYGTEPVMSVTIYGEALFQTDWSRSLMPVDILKKLPQTALRQEDAARITTNP